MKRHFFHLDLDCFFAAVETVEHPELKGKPVCVGGMRDQRGIVACPNYEARAYGVRTAMPLREAGRLLPRDAIFMRGNHRLYGEYSRRVMRILETFTPDVHPKSIDEAMLDVTGCLHLWENNPARMASAIKERVRAETGLTLSAGIAPNPLCAKIAAGLRKPDGLVLVPHGGVRDFLAPLPVDVVPGIGVKTAPLLRAHGIRTVGDLLARGPGRDGYTNKLLEALLDEEGRAVEPADGDVEHSISRDTTFHNDTADPEQIAATLFALTERCCETLRAEGLTTSTISVRVRFADFTTVQKQVTTATPLLNEEDVYAVARKLLEGLLPPWRFVRLVGIKVSSLAPLEGQQLSLDAPENEKLDGLHRKIDMLRERYGRGSLQWGIVAGKKPRGNKK